MAKWLRLPKAIRDQLKTLPEAERRKAAKAIRDQIKPLSVALTDQAKTFYLAVGQGITHWSRMEGRLVQVVAKLLGTTEPKAGLVMYSIINLHTWIQIIDELLELDGTYPNSFKLWRGIAKAVRKEIDNRLRLAHHALSQEEEEWETPKGTKARGVAAYLRPSQLDVRTKTRNMKPLTMVEIVAFTGRVGDIHSDLISLLELTHQPQSSR
jgi:hypothetical protein